MANLSTSDLFNQSTLADGKEARAPQTDIWPEMLAWISFINGDTSAISIVIVDGNKLTGTNQIPLRDDWVID